MRFTQIAFTTAMLVTLSACSGVETQPSSVEAFAEGNYQFYSWRSEPLKNTTNSRDTIYRLDPLLRESLDKALRDKGYRLNKELAQFSVDYVFAGGTIMGEKASEASNLQIHPGTINRQVNQAVVDNANALAGVKETSNIALLFNDVKRREQVWRVVITKIVEDTNATDIPRLRKAVDTVVKQGLKTLPAAN